MNNLKKILFGFTPKTQKGVLLWMLCVLLLLHFLSFVLISEKKYLHFIEALFPALALFFGLMIHELMNMEKKIKVFVGALLVAFVFSNGVALFGLFQSYALSMPRDEFDVPLKDIEAVVIKIEKCDISDVYIENKIEGYEKAFEYMLRQKGVVVSNKEERCSFVISKSDEDQGGAFGRVTLFKK